MPTTIDFEAVNSGFTTSYSEDGFTLTSDISTSIPSQNQPFWSGKSFSNVTDGGYLLNNYSSDTVIVRNDEGKAFGASSIGIDGFNWTGFGGGGTARAGSSSVTFTFTGIRAGDNMAFDWTAPATDLTEGFQNILLPPEFASGLIELRWTVSGGTGWGAFDNLNVQVNRAPTVDAISVSTTAGATLEQTFLGHDADNQALTYEILGGQPEGVFLGDNGTFFVISDPNAGGSQAITFQYRAFDGSEYSAPATVTVTVAPPPAGPDIKGTKRADTLEGTAGGERMYGLDGNDKLDGAGGADKIYGGDGKDTLSGGEGHDVVKGEDGADRIDGGAGNDTITGDDGADSLSGGDGNDLVFGCDDRDTITGGAGADTLSGGDDSDQFVFGAAFGKDVILDFRPGSWRHDRDNDGYDDHDRDHDSHHDHGHGWNNDNGRDQGRGWNNDNGHDDHWNAGDTIRISPAAFGSFADLMAHAQQTWYGVVITTADGQDSITLVGVSLRSLHANDFIFS